MTGRIDPPKYSGAEDRCVHDQLILAGRSTCSICQGLPDVPELEDAAAAVDLLPAPHRWVITVESATDCVRCYTPLPLGRPAIFSAREGGPVGPCCEAVA